MKNRASGFSGTRSGPSGQDPPFSRYLFGLDSRPGRFGIAAKLRHRRTAPGRCSQTPPRPPSQTTTPLNVKTQPTPQQWIATIRSRRHSRAFKPRHPQVPEHPVFWTQWPPVAGRPVFRTRPRASRDPAPWAFSPAPACPVFWLSPQGRLCPVFRTARLVGLCPVPWTDIQAGREVSAAHVCLDFRTHQQVGGCLDVWTHPSVGWRQYFWTRASRGSAELISDKAEIQEETPLQRCLLRSSGRVAAIADQAFRACGTSIPKGKKSSGARSYSVAMGTTDQPSRSKCTIPQIQEPCQSGWARRWSPPMSADLHVALAMELSGSGEQQAPRMGILEWSSCGCLHCRSRGGRRRCQTRRERRL